LDPLRAHSVSQSANFLSTVTSTGDGNEPVNPVDGFVAAHRRIAETTEEKKDAKLMTVLIKTSFCRGQSPVDEPWHGICPREEK